jgi:dCTP deaminase
MILSDRDIVKFIKDGKIRITPKPNFKEGLGPCSLDLHLGNSFKVFRPSQYPFIDLKRKIDLEQVMEEIIVKDGFPFILQPRDFVIAVTKEEILLDDDIMGRLDGRSSLGRLGIVVHSTAARFDPGWKGKAVMELGNLNIMPVVLYAGMRICAMTFETLSSPAERPYTEKKDSKYKKQKSADASRITKEFS